MSNLIDNIDKKFESFCNKNVLVIGDVMIDAYMWGMVVGTSPEAPVPVVAIDKRENRLGGAANVALNIKALGANPIICGVCGIGEKADLLALLLSEQHLNSHRLIHSPHRKTTVKTRIISNNKHVLRVDEEQRHDLEPKIEVDFINSIKTHLNTIKIDLVIFEDYNKGVLTPTVITTVIAEAKKLNIPITVDPKKNNFFAYKGVNIFKPNLKELCEGTGHSLDPENIDLLRSAASNLSKKLEGSAILTTLSEHGMFIFNNSDFQLTPAHQRNIVDVSGAGDTVISVVSLCLAVGLPLNEIIEIANISGGLVCQYPGVVPINKKELLLETKRLFS